jgi:hypothetical protein
MQFFLASIWDDLWSKAFMATNINEIFSNYQLYQFVKSRRVRDGACPWNVDF